MLESLLVPLLVPLEGGLLDFVQGKNADVLTTVRDVGLTIAVFFIVFKAIEAKFSMARVVIALMAAGIFLWGLNNVDTIKGWFKNEAEASTPVQVVHPGPPSGSAGDASGDTRSGPPATGSGSSSSGGGSGERP